MGSKQVRLSTLSSKMDNSRKSKKSKRYLVDSFKKIVNIGFFEEAEFKYGLYFSATDIKYHNI